MELVVNNEKNIAINSYVFHWVLPSMRRYIQTGLDKRLLSNYAGFEDEVTLRQDLISAVSQLQVLTDEDKKTITIRLNPNLFNTSKTAKLYDICKLVNYGNTSCPAYPIFTKMFDFFAEKFWTYYWLYEMGVLRPCH